MLVMIFALLNGFMYWVLCRVYGTENFWSDIVSERRIKECVDSFYFLYVWCFLKVTGETHLSKPSCLILFGGLICVVNLGINGLLALFFFPSVFAMEFWTNLECLEISKKVSWGVFIGTNRIYAFSRK